MDEKLSHKIIAFDTLFTTNNIQMLKIIISHLSPSVQKNFAVYIKLLELQYTLSFFQNHPHAVLGGASNGDNTQIFDEILPFCDKTRQNQIIQMKNMLQTFENMQEMMEMLQMMNELFPNDGGNPSDNSVPNSDLLSNLAGMAGMDLSGMPDLSQLMDLFRQP